MAVIYADANSAVAALFGRTTEATQSYIQNSVNQFMGNIGMSQASDFVRQQLMDSYENFKHSTVGRAAQAVRQQMNAYWQRDAVYALNTVGEVQNAPAAMVPYLMAVPEIRQSYHRGEINGWDDRYSDPQPGVVGDHHYEYQRIMDGVLQSNGHVKHYLGGLRAGLERLTPEEKLAVFSTARVTQRELDEGINDPTSKWNDVLI